VNDFFSGLAQQNEHLQYNEDNNPGEELAA
jgi:hypothetical protein